MHRGMYGEDKNYPFRDKRFIIIRKTESASVLMLAILLPENEKDLSSYITDKGKHYTMNFHHIVTRQLPFAGLS